MVSDKVTTDPRGDVVISSGHKNFHMLFTAAEMANRGRLCMLLSGAYPGVLEHKIFSAWPFSRSRKLKRFLCRKENIPDYLVRQCRSSEVISSTGLVLDRLFSAPVVSESMQVSAFRTYGRNASKQLKNIESKCGRIYHYRAGFGQSSVDTARSLGMTTVCDHSIVHPALLHHLIVNHGVFPEAPPADPTGMWGAVLHDIENADKVLVNSNFVRDTFAFMGFPEERIAVVYQGVESKFMDNLPSTRDYVEKSADRPVRMLFAGSIGPRKGMDELSEALLSLGNGKYEVHLAGSLSPKNRHRYAQLLVNPRVTYHGMLSQADLSKLMSHADVFVFPSRAEGSARVIFEAMAAGCAVITTLNSGSVVEHGKNGFIIPVNDKEAILAALMSVLEAPNTFSYMGSHNWEFVRKHYLQKNYGDNLEKVYG